jgi:hypothetical protein
VIKVVEGSAMKVAGCSTATVMALWKVERGDNQPKQQAVDGRMSKMAKFLAYIKKPSCFDHNVHRPLLCSGRAHGS